MDAHNSALVLQILKMACIKDAPLFDILEAYGPEIIASGFQVPAWTSALQMLQSTDVQLCIAAVPTPKLSIVLAAAATSPTS